MYISLVLRLGIPSGPVITGKTTMYLKIIVLRSSKQRNCTMPYFCTVRQTLDKILQS